MVIVGPFYYWFDILSEQTIGKPKRQYPLRQYPITHSVILKLHYIMILRHILLMIVAYYAYNKENLLRHNACFSAIPPSNRISGLFTVPSI